MRLRKARPPLSTLQGRGPGTSRLRVHQALLSASKGALTLVSPGRWTEGQCPAPAVSPSVGALVCRRGRRAGPRLQKGRVSCRRVGDRGDFGGHFRPQRSTSVSAGCVWWLRQGACAQVDLAPSPAQQLAGGADWPSGAVCLKRWWPLPVSSVPPRLAKLGWGTDPLRPALVYSPGQPHL